MLPRAAAPARPPKRVVAGKEAGCAFYFLFHTAFVGRGGELKVPLAMTDKAFKNKRGRYCADGVAHLAFEADEAYDGFEPAADLHQEPTTQQPSVKL